MPSIAPWRFRSSGTSASPKSIASLGLFGLISFPLNMICPESFFAAPKMSCASSVRPAPTSPPQTEDLTSADFQGYVLIPVAGDIFKLQDNIVFLDAVSSRRVCLRQLTPYHKLDKLLRMAFFCDKRLHILSVAHD